MIGREFSLEQLKPLIDDMTEDRLLGGAGGGARYEENRGAAQERRSLQFTHALIQETLAEELSTTRRVRLHAA